MSKLAVLSIAFILVVIIILPASLTLLIRIIPGGIQPPLGNTEKIYGTVVLSQEFISPGENLSGIGVSIKNPNFANKKKTTINIYDDGDRLIRTVILDGQNIADGKFIKILFEPISHSKNKKFSWSVFSPESNFDDALQIFLTDKRPDWSLDFKVNDKLSNQTLSYVTLHKPARWITVLEMVAEGWIYKIKQDSIFFVVYSLLLVILLAVISSRSLRLSWKKDS